MKSDLMEKNPEFDDIRPYYNDEVTFGINKLLKNSQFRKAVNDIINNLLQDKSWEQIERLLQPITNQYNFQYLLVKEIIYNLINRTATGATCKGWENISQQNAYTYISNHRDIILDAALLNVLLLDRGYDTVEIAIGDNLLLNEWIKDMVRLNKSFIVKRSVSGRQVFEVSKHLSKYIHYTIREKNQSIWISQREGRAKDSNDRTQGSLLKMLAMGSNQHFLQSLAEINLTPLTFSYEYDPCDYLKAKESQQKRDNPNFNKTWEDDLLNIRTGLYGYKGMIHLQIGQPVNPSLLKLDNSLGRNELASQVTSLIDNEIFLNYKFYPVNYIAYDRLWGKDFFRNEYTSDDIEKFDLYFQQQLDKIDLPDKDIPYLTKKMEEMYAYPVKNYLSATSGD